MYIAVFVQQRHCLYQRSESSESKSRFALKSEGGMLKGAFRKVFGDDPTLCHIGIKKLRQAGALLLTCPRFLYQS